MNLDILIFALIAAFLIYRLNAVLGTRSGSERQRPNPFNPADPQRPRPLAAAAAQAAVPAQTFTLPIANHDEMIDAASNQDGRVDTGLHEIAAVDPFFELNTFLQGARYAFEMIVTAYARGDLEALKSLLSPKLYGDFAAGVKARNQDGHTTELILHRIKSARINEAHMGGTIAYITVDFEVDETTVTRDAAGQVVDGHPDNIFNIRDIWTFMRDTRTSDPNWVLIETKALDK